MTRQERISVMATAGETTPVAVEAPPGAHTSGGAALRSRREALHWSQERLSRAVGCSSKTIANYEAGHAYVSTIMKRIEAALKEEEEKTKSEQG